MFDTGLFAQGDRGTITDSAGAVVLSASITARNTETEAAYQTVSTATGDYTIAAMPAGNYQLTVAALDSINISGREFRFNWR